MQKKIRLILILCFVANAIFAQDIVIPNYTDEMHLLDRLEVQGGKILSNINLTTKGISAKDAVSLLEDGTEIFANNDVQEKNRAIFLLKNAEWLTNDEQPVNSKKSLFGVFYKEPANFFSYNKNNIFFAVNPIIYYQQSKELGSNRNVFVNTRGFELKGHLQNKISFYSQLTDNQERGPLYFNDFVNRIRKVPGVGYVKNFKGDGFDYTNARGYISAQVVKNHLTATFGHDKQFIGNGFRSLLLGDFAPNQLFVKLNTQFWKIHYQNLFMELFPTNYLGADTLLPRKYAAMHTLSVNVAPKWQISAFEAVVFSRKNHFEFQYLNPVIFYRTIEQQTGSPDNAMLGFDTKVLPIKNVELYAQALLDEFSFSHLKARDKWWANKQAVQLGLKYTNVAGIANLDAQLERNYIRPFTYSYKDSLADYSNYNQPLAHPNGANLIENIFILRYQPIVKLVVKATVIQRQQGLDTSATFSNGGNILIDYNLRQGQNFGFATLNGNKTTTLFANLNASFQWKPNIYVDGGFTYRKVNSLLPISASTSKLVYVGLRCNITQRLYDY